MEAKPTPITSNARRRVSRTVRVRLHPTASGVVVSFPLALWRTLRNIFEHLLDLVASDELTITL